MRPFPDNMDVHDGRASIAGAEESEEVEEVGRYKVELMPRLLLL